MLESLAPLRAMSSRTVLDSNLRNLRRRASSNLGFGAGTRTVAITSGSCLRPGPENWC